MSTSGLPYLERKRIMSPVRARPRYQADALRSHFRPVKHLPVLLGPDSPATRVLTQDDRDRIPYLPVTGPTA
jgi:hypothetical protein